MIAIVKYNAGNTRSVKNALNRLGIEAVLTDNSELLQKADKVIFPGVGEASTAMDYLRNRGLDEVLKNLKQPFLGICLGMQLMCSHSEENNTDCLGIFPEKVKRFNEGIRVPHMGWNNFEMVSGPLFNGINTYEDVYFVHAYYVEKGKDTSAVTDYHTAFSSAIQKDNFYGVQFHPEKSAETGMKILTNFLAT
jgi:glutamine amidotransferase